MTSSLEPVDEFEDEGTLVVEQRFAIVPEWVLDADISDAALRLYAVLLRYGQTSGERMPGRRLLATRLRKKSKDSVDRALKELVALGAVVVQHRRQGQVNLTNRYVVRSTAPQAAAHSGVDEVDAVPVVADSAVEPADEAKTDLSRGGRNFAATPGRTDATTLAANLRPNPEALPRNHPLPVPLEAPAVPACKRRRTSFVDCSTSMSTRSPSTAAPPAGDSA